jgi:hypothetical protein
VQLGVAVLAVHAHRGVVHAHGRRDLRQRARARLGLRLALRAADALDVGAAVGLPAQVGLQAVDGQRGADVALERGQHVDVAVDGRDLHHGLALRVAQVEALDAHVPAVRPRQALDRERAVDLLVDLVHDEVAGDRRAPDRREGQQQHEEDDHDEDDPEPAAAAPRPLGRPDRRALRRDVPLDVRTLQLVLDHPARILAKGGAVRGPAGRQV